MLVMIIVVMIILVIVVILIITLIDCWPPAGLSESCLLLARPPGQAPAHYKGLKGVFVQKRRAAQKLSPWIPGCS